MDGKLWFKRKQFGWGWTPCSREGWLIIILAIAYLLYSAQSLRTADNVWPFLLNVFIVVALLIAISFAKGERPKWQWG